MEIGPWIISGIALLQVWVIALVKWSIRPRVTIYETGNLEVGYASFGPSIAIAGTLHVNKSSIFIKQISCTVTCKSDNATRNLKWKAFRSIEIFPEKPTLEIAGGFLLSSTAPYRFNIFFSDPAFISEISPKLKDTPSRWFTFKQTKFAAMSEEHNVDQNTLSQYEFALEYVYTEFCNSNGILEEYSALNNAFYWKPGKYSLEVEVKSEKNKTACSFKRQFEISEEQSQQLRLNCIQQCRDLLGLTTNYSFVYPEYQNPNDSHSPRQQ